MILPISVFVNSDFIYAKNEGGRGGILRECSRYIRQAGVARHRAVMFIDLLDIIDEIDKN